MIRLINKLKKDKFIIYGLYAQADACAKWGELEGRLKLPGLSS